MVQLHYINASAIVNANINGSGTLNTTTLNMGISQTRHLMETFTHTLTTNTNIKVSGDLNIRSVIGNNANR
jgi:hypothetical protein